MRINCKCLEKFSKHLTSECKIKDSTNFEIDGPFNESLVFSTMKKQYTIDCVVKQREVKKNGDSYKNLTKRSIGLKVNFCPFCGVELLDD